MTLSSDLQRLAALDPATYQSALNWYSSLMKDVSKNLEGDFTGEENRLRDALLQLVLQEAIAARRWGLDSGYAMKITPSRDVFVWTAVICGPGKMYEADNQAEAILKAYVATLEAIQ